MIGSRWLSPVLAASLALAPGARAQAQDLGGAVAAALLLGILAGAAQPQNRAARGARQGGSRPTASAEQLEANRQVQRALNHFDYEVGTADGILGPRSRSGITQFQAAMGFPASGDLRPTERQFLLNSHARAQSDMFRAPYDEIHRRLGPRGLLRSYRNQDLGIPPATLGAGAPDFGRGSAPAPIAPAPPPASQVASLPPTPVPPPAAEAEPRPLALPRPMPAAASLASHCAAIDAVTQATGRATAANPGDPDTALSQEFCGLRTFAISDFSRRIEDLGVDAASLGGLCITVTAALDPILSDLAVLQPQEFRDVVHDELVEVFGASDPQTEQGLIQLGEPCLGMGYRSDDARAALAAAAMLSALGVRAYDEVVGHHLIGGFGVESDPYLGERWILSAADALDAGERAVFFPGMTASRFALMRTAFATRIRR